MGYRSHGVVALDKELYEEFQMLQIKLPSILIDMDFEPKSDHVAWHFSGYKMYPGYSEVDELEEFFTFLQGGGSWQGMEECPERWENQYQYIRIGEDSGDIEESGVYEWYYTSTHIQEY